MNRHIARDTYTGRHTVCSNNKRSDVFTARELAAMAQGEGRPFWEFSGHVHGVALYVRTRFIGQADGSLAGYDSEGCLKVVHPAGRKVRVITG